MYERLDVLSFHMDLLADIGDGLDSLPSTSTFLRHIEPDHRGDVSEGIFHTKVKVS